MINILKGILIGITNIIPGISAGTTITLLGIYNTINTNTKSKNITLIIKLFTGILIGWKIFSKLLEYLFTNHYYTTIYFFISLIIFCLPPFIKSNLNYKEVKPFYIIIGIIIILLLGIFRNNTYTTSNILFNLNLNIIKDMILIGFISGFITIIPGISGSMVLLIINKYNLYQTYLARISFDYNILIPVLIMIIFMIIGGLISYRITNFFLNKYNVLSYNIIIGLILGSIIILIPIKYSIVTIFNSILGIFLGYLVFKTYNIIIKKQS